MSHRHEETIIRNNNNNNVSTTEGYRNHPKVLSILRNPNVSEVRIKIVKRERDGSVQQPYICIIFNDGSSIERPLYDLLDNEDPVCPAPDGLFQNNPDEECTCPPSRKNQMVPQRKSKWGFLTKMKYNRDNEIANILRDNENVTVERILVRKGCGCEPRRGRGIQEVIAEDYNYIDQE